MSELSSIDQSVLELLAASRDAAKQEVIQAAQLTHETSLKQDEKLTMIGLVGAEALHLYGLMESRETYFMGPDKRPTVLDRLKAGVFDEQGRAYDFARRRRIKKYAALIRQARDNDISDEEALRWADQEVGRIQQENHQNEFLREIGHGDQVVMISASGYEYCSPPLFKTAPEQIDGLPITQYWRVKAKLPCTYTQFLRVINISHEVKYDSERKSTSLYTMDITKHNKVKEVSEYTSEGQKTVSEEELYFPLGLLVAAQTAVIESVPKKISKRW